MTRTGQSAMAIEKGADWGWPGRLPPDAPVATSDAEAAALVGAGAVVFGVGSGDLARTLGTRLPFDRAAVRQLLPVDAFRVVLDDGSTHIGVAHAMVGNLLVSGHVVVVMNAAFIGSRNLAPRAHPGDGQLDVVTLRLGFADRCKAVRRMATGTHVPHPGIEIRRRAAGTIELGRRRRIAVDGRRVGASRSLSFEVLPELLVIGV